jgi:cytochrome oxidase complex assembly protein 1
MSYGYVPAPPPPPVPQKSWFARNRKWFLPTIILGPLLLLALFVSVIFGALFGLMKSSEPYKNAVATASHDARVSEQLGKPITPGWYATGNISVENDSGDAQITIPLNGTRRHGTVYVEAKKSAGIWRYQRLEVEMEGVPDRVNLLPGTPPEGR